MLFYCSKSFLKVGLVATENTLKSKKGFFFKSEEVTAFPTVNWFTSQRFVLTIVELSLLSLISGLFHSYNPLHELFDRNWCSHSSIQNFFKRGSDFGPFDRKFSLEKTLMAFSALQQAFQYRDCSLSTSTCSSWNWVEIGPFIKTYKCLVTTLLLINLHKNIW